MKNYIILLFWLFAACFNPMPAGAETVDFERLYLGARFSEVILYFETKEKQKDYREFSLKEKLLFIESLARTAKVRSAQKKLKPLLAANPSDAAVLSAAGVVYLSSGHLGGAQKYIDEALRLEPGCKRAMLARVMLLLYYREYREAEKWYRRLLTADSASKWADSDLVFLVGLDVYRARRDTKKLGDLYKSHAGRLKNVNKRHRENLKSNHRMYKKAAKKALFHTETGTGKVVIPFATGEKVLRVNTIAITVDGKIYKVLLDTGNGTGWILHSRELMEYLDPRVGGPAFTRIGTETILLDGYRHYYRTVDFNGFKIHRLDGVYVPKPHPAFPDANLNPVFIDNRVVTIDFGRSELVLRTKEQFEKDLASASGPGIIFARLPWYGYKYPFVPVEVKGKQAPGLAMIETGAEDIALKLDFASGLGLPLEPRLKYLANGKEFRYHHTPVTLWLGKFRFQRKAAEVWPFKGFYNRLTGLTADVVVGPAAFRGKTSVSFDPFDNRIVLMQSAPPAPAK